MARRKKEHGEGGGHERWLVSYADFITLLFALFVVLFATSQQDKKMPAKVAEAVRQAMEHSRFEAAAAAHKPSAKPEPEHASAPGPGGAQAAAPGSAHREVKAGDLAASYELLQRELKHDIAAGQVEVSMQPRGLVVSFKQTALFPSGEDSISPSAYPTVGKVAGALSKVPNPVRLEGHTDSVPIHTPRFNSNWELSAARSIALLELLAERHGLPRARMSVAGYAEIAPMADNATESGRAMNRRVDVVILNEAGSVSEPGYRAERKPDQVSKEEHPPHAGRQPSS